MGTIRTGAWKADTGPRKCIHPDPQSLGCDLHHQRASAGVLAPRPWRGHPGSLDRPSAIPGPWSGRACQYCGQKETSAQKEGTERWKDKGWGPQGSSRSRRQGHNFPSAASDGSPESSWQTEIINLGRVILVGLGLSFQQQKNTNPREREPGKYGQQFSISFWAWPLPVLFL